MNPPDKALLAPWQCQCDDALLAKVTALLRGVAEKRALDRHLLGDVISVIGADLAAEPLRQLVWHFPKPPVDWRALHALNAARVGMFIGSKRESSIDASRLATIGLLYDIGMWLPELAGVVDGAAALDEAAMEKLTRHPVAGAELLARTGLDEPAVRVAREHHERPDGSGYPASLTRNRLHDDSLLFQIIDSFLGQVEPRSFRAARSPVDAMARLTLQGQRGHYDMPTLRRFIADFGLFPIGSVLKLSTGEWALCAGVADDLKRPPVLLLTDAQGDARKKPLLLRLADHPSVEIADGVASVA